MENRRPVACAMIPAAQLTAAPPAAGALLCAVSLVASARPMAIQLPKLPELKLPKLPELDLPNFGKKKGEDSSPKAKAAPARVPVARGANVKVRAAKGVIATGSSPDAPTLAEVTGETTQDTIAAGQGWKKFPERRMPGANMDRWKQVAKDITPKA